ncbi:BCCT family transporter [Desulfonatronospira sp.]|uniref:BCCT family transporter n=1 Tax=Desulfonatronospira sp. TaxID=1962951 RepID=UPI0025BCB376|nr:BCCT family transporter [Desulfonatronospira sp.]
MELKSILKRNIVFVISLLAILLVILAGIFSAEALDRWSAWLHGKIISNFGWFYLIATFMFLVFSLYMALSKYGHIKLGMDYEKPRFSYFGWASMLFAAGMGIGLIFWSVAEPMSHYMHPPGYIEPRSPEAARFAMLHSFFHWGVHPWAVYVVMSLCIAYFSFRRGMPPLISSCFYPLIGDRINGFAGYLIDILAVFATVFGIVTSLGLGAMQINSGLASILPFEADIFSTLVIIGIITIIFMGSSLAGLDKGMQIMSKGNVMLAVLLLAFMLVLGPTNMILNIFISTASDYITALFNISLTANPFIGLEWTQDWTLFYWAWWISWSPFVGLFIASISRGRTIREFITGALLIPTGLTFVWFSVFGGTAFSLELGNDAGIAAAVAQDISTGLFHLYAFFPLSAVLTLITILLLVIFFVTSADAATFVLSLMTSRGKADPPTGKKIVWGLTVAVTAAILLLAGGLEGLQRMAIAAALPFSAIMLLMCACLLRGLRYEFRYERQE